MDDTSFANFGTCLYIDRVGKKNRENEIKLYRLINLYAANEKEKISACIAKKIVYQALGAWLKSDFKEGLIGESKYAAFQKFYQDAQTVDEIIQEGIRNAIAYYTCHRQKVEDNKREWYQWLQRQGLNPFDFRPL